MSLRAISPVIHVLVIRPSGGVVRGGPVAVVVGRCTVGVVVGCGSVACPAVARGVIVAGGGASGAGGAVACCAVGSAGGAVGIGVGVVSHFVTCDWLF